MKGKWMKADHKDIGNLDIGNKKIVIYGVGRIFERYKEYLNWENVVAIVDIDVNKQAESIYQRMDYSRFGWIFVLQKI